MRTRIILIGIVLFTVLALSCNTSNKPQNFDYGHVENGKYLNSFFGFEVGVPANWVVQTKEQSDNLSAMGKEAFAGDNQNMKALISASEVNTANLLTVFKYEMGSPVDFNPSFIFVAENLKFAPGIKSGSDYLFQTRKLLKQSQMQFDYLDEEFTKVVISSHEFYVMNASINSGGTIINQRYYSTIQDGFCLSSVISFANDEQKSELEKVISTIKFNK